MAARRVAYVFPGQGSQKAGMGRAWAEVSPAARATLAEADAVLGWPLTRLCWEGPEEELNLTANTVRTHLQNILAKLGVHSTLEAVALTQAWSMPPDGH